MANAIHNEGLLLHQPCCADKADLEARWVGRPHAPPSPRPRSHHHPLALLRRSHISDEIAKDALQFVLNPSNHPLLLTVSSAGGLEVATLVGCLRRLQHWRGAHAWIPAGGAAEALPLRLGPPRAAITPHTTYSG